MCATINGALKSINHSDVTQDPNHDGTGNGFSPMYFGQTFNYYDNDYTGALTIPPARLDRRC